MIPIPKIQRNQRIRKIERSERSERTERTEKRTWAKKSIVQSKAQSDPGYLKNDFSRLMEISHEATICSEILAEGRSKKFEQLRNQQIKLITPYSELFQHGFGDLFSGMVEEGPFYDIVDSRESDVHNSAHTLKLLYESFEIDVKDFEDWDMKEFGDIQWVNSKHCILSGSVEVLNKCSMVGIYEGGQLMYHFHYDVGKEGRLVRRIKECVGGFKIIHKDGLELCLDSGCGIVRFDLATPYHVQYWVGYILYYLFPELMLMVQCRLGFVNFMILESRVHRG